MISGNDRTDVNETAYKIWEAEGRPHGKDLEHWLRAEEQVAEMEKAANKVDPKAEDDLKKITGVGPVLEQKLNELGITRYEQIAAFSPADIDRIGGILKCKSRITRDGWVKQAKKLAAK